MNEQKKGIKIIRRNHARGNTKPSTKYGNFARRGLVTFSTGNQILRLGVDLVFSVRQKKPSVIEFVALGGRGKTARFYFPLHMEDAEVKKIVLDWFKQTIQVGEPKVQLVPGDL